MISHFDELIDDWAELHGLEVRISDPNERASVALGIMGHAAFLLRSALNDGGHVSADISLVFRLIERELERAKADQKRNG